MDALDTQDPQTVGPYRVLGRIGEGGMGRVYLARNAGGRSVALKFIHADMAAAPGFRQRFRREVEVVQRVAGVGTVPVVDAGVDEQHPWYASEYVPGPSVQEAVDRFGPLTADALWRFAADLAETLEHVHGQRLVHRDLKPSNVLLATSGPRLIDFGIVHAAMDTMLTQSGKQPGTPAYMSPEQVYGEAVSPASDVYSYGLTLAFAATGFQPRRGSLSGELPGVGPELDAFIRQCLDPEPERRPAAGTLKAQARAQDTTTDAWLPSQVASLIARTSEQLLNLEAQADGPGYTAPGAGGTGGTGGTPGSFGASGGAGFQGAGFHGAATQGPASGPGAAPPPPQPPPEDINRAFFGTSGPYGQTTPPGSYGAGTYRPYATHQSWPGATGVPGPGPGGPGGRLYGGGMLGRPLFGLLWLIPMAVCSYLLVFADPGFFSVLRAVVIPTLLVLGILMMTKRAGNVAALMFWLGLSLLTVQTWWAVGAYQPYSGTADATRYQTLVASLNEFLIIFPALGSIVSAYVLPASIGRFGKGLPGERP
jgi:hypothetical protein